MAVTAFAHVALPSLGPNEVYGVGRLRYSRERASVEGSWELTMTLRNSGSPDTMINLWVLEGDSGVTGDRLIRSLHNQVLKDLVADLLVRDPRIVNHSFPATLLVAARVEQGAITRFRLLDLELHSIHSSLVLMTVRWNIRDQPYRANDLDTHESHRVLDDLAEWGTLQP